MTVTLASVGPLGLMAVITGWTRGLVVGLPAGLLLAWLVGKALRRMSGPELKKHYLRLGRFAPDAPCPCGQGNRYAACCRPRDIERLERDVVGYLSQRWSRGSYKGRRRISSMKNRLQDHPLPPVVLPGWVSDPGLYKFPIADNILREWKPDQRRAKRKPRRTK